MGDGAGRYNGGRMPRNLSDSLSSLHQNILQNGHSESVEPVLGAEALKYAFNGLHSVR